MAEGGVITAEEATANPFMWVTVCDSMMADIGEGEKLHYTIRSTSTDPLFPKFNTTTRRSYSDFQNLAQLLASRHVEPIPPLPVINLGIEEEVWLKQLEDFIQKILDIPALRSDPHLGLFLQSKDSMRAIRAKVEANEQSQDLLDQSREPKDQAAAEGDDNGAQQISMHRLSIAPVRRDEIPESRDEVPLRRPGRDGSAVALPGAIPGSRPQRIPLRRPGPDGSAVAHQGRRRHKSEEELIFAMDDVN